MNDLVNPAYRKPFTEQSYDRRYTPGIHGEPVTWDQISRAAALQAEANLAIIRRLQGDNQLS
jgi:hypothetical protein